ncbi:transposase [Bradyrhizobium sp. 17]|nr:transposase [Bradyrhizobium sp. 17]
MASIKRDEQATGCDPWRRSSIDNGASRERCRCQGFRSGRDCSAWVGLVPKQNSSGARTSLAVSASKAIAIYAACSQRAHAP